MKANSDIHSVVRVLAILETFSRKKTPLSLTEAAKENHISLATAHRYFSTLKKSGYLMQDPDSKKYQLTFKALDIGFSFLHTMPLRNRVLLHMAVATKELGVTSQCAILDDTEILYIERIRANNVVNIDISTGSRLPVYATSMGKAMMAFLDAEERDSIIKRIKFAPLTPHTITGKKALLDQLETIRRMRYAINNEELALGLKTIAAPIFKDGKVEAALGFSLPSNHMQKRYTSIDVLAKRLLDLTNKVSIGQLPI